MLLLLLASWDIRNRDFILFVTVFSLSCWRAVERINTGASPIFDKRAKILYTSAWLFSFLRKRRLTQSSLKLKEDWVFLVFNSKDLLLFLIFKSSFKSSTTYARLLPIPSTAIGHWQPRVHPNNKWPSCYHLWNLWRQIWSRCAGMGLVLAEKALWKILTS